MINIDLQNALKCWFQSSVIYGLYHKNELFFASCIWAAGERSLSVLHLTFKIPSFFSNEFRRFWPFAINFIFAETIRLELLAKVFKT